MAEERRYVGPEPQTIRDCSNEITSLKELLFARLNAMDTAVQVFHGDLVRVPTETDKAVTALKELIFARLAEMEIARELVHETLRQLPIDRSRELATLKDLVLQMLATQDVKFGSVNTEFVLRDERVKQTATDTKVAVDAALQAAEKAVQKQNESFSLSIDKSEKATLEQINQQRLLLQTATQGLNDKIDDLKERMTRLEGAGVGAAVSSTRDYERMDQLQKEFLAQKALSDNVVGRNAVQAENKTSLMTMLGIGAAIAIGIASYLKP